MKKDIYIKATVSIEPTMDAVKKKRVKETLEGPLSGKLVITGWKNACPTTMEIAGALVQPEEKTSPAKPKKVRAGLARKKKGQ